MDRLRASRRVVDRFVATWAVGAVLAVALVVAWAGWPAGWLIPVAVLAAAIGLADRVQLVVRLDRVTAAFTLVEAGVVAAILLAPPAHALVAALLGSIVSTRVRRLDRRRTVFHVAQVTVASAVAVAVVHAVPAWSPAIAGRSVLATFLGMTLYNAVSTVAILGVLRRLGDPDGVEAVRRDIPISAGTALGTTAVGVLFAHLWLVDPALVPLLVAPGVAVHLAARGTVRSAALLDQVRSDRDQLTRIVDGASDGILLVGGDGRVQVWNPAMVRFTGLPEHAVVGRLISEVLTDAVRRSDEPVRGRWLVDEAESTSPRRESAATFVDREGRTRAVRESHALVFDDRGRCTGDVIVVSDVSRQEELARLRSDFVARVSHELRTPLTPIRGFAALLLRRGSVLGDEERSEVAGRILERATHLEALVEDLLLVTRVDRGELDGLVELTTTDVAETLEPLVAELRTGAQPHTIRFRPGGRALAVADPGRLRQVVEALLDNAVRYSPAGEPVDLTVTCDGVAVRVTVADRGPGVPAEDRDRIFERFHRLEDPLTMRTSGVGLGLFLARRLTEAMGGTLVLADDPVTRFVVTLPAATTTATGDPAVVA